MQGIHSGGIPWKVHELHIEGSSTSTASCSDMAVKFELPITQKSTIVAFVLTLVLAVALSPLGKMEFGRDELFAGLLRLAHLFCFAAWLGVQIWVTFFAGKCTRINVSNSTFLTQPFLQA